MLYDISIYSSEPEFIANITLEELGIVLRELRVTALYQFAVWANVNGELKILQTEKMFKYVKDVGFVVREDYVELV
jgi:hypothetical protein